MSGGRRLSVLLRALVLLPALVHPAGAQVSAQVSPRGLEAILTPPLQAASEANHEGDVAVVVYFDYNCPVCRKLEPELELLAGTDPHIRIIHKHWPIFGGVSAYAAYSALAAANLGQYRIAHTALIRTQGDLKTFEDVDRALQAAGLDVASIHDEIKRHQPGFSATLTRNQNEAEALSLRGTPGLVIGDRLTAGFLSVQQLREQVAAARASPP